MAISVYSLEPDDLKRLGADRAVEMFRRLLIAESSRLDFPQSHLHISLDVTTADGGIDASVDNLPNGINSNIIISRTTKYQIKTGDTFMPWQPAKLKAELFTPLSKGKKSKKGEPRPPKTSSKTPSPSIDRLKEGIRDCLDNKGTYVLVCFGIDLVDTQRKKAKQELTRLLNACGYETPSIEIWGAGELRNFFELYPSLCLEISGRQEPFLSHTQWAATEEMSRPFRSNDARSKTIEQIRSSLRSRDPVQIRVCGEPGLGKTRLILEATREDDLSPAVVYWERAEDFLRSQQFRDLRTPHAKYFVILIIDECDFENSARVWNVLKSRSANVRIITIHFEFDERGPSDMVLPELALLDSTDIAAILASYGAPFDIARQYSELCSGSPRVAHIVGENLRDTAIVTTPRATMGDVWNRYIAGRHYATELVERRKLIISFLALFKKFGFLPPVNDEAAAIFRLISAHTSQIGQLEFNSTILEFKSRRILQGEKTLYITPRLFHVWLWSEWWRTHGQTLNVIDLLQHLPASLFDWFGQMFRYAKGFGAAVSQVNILLGSNGPFANGEFLRSDAGARFFYRWQKRARVKLLERWREL